MPEIRAKVLKPHAKNCAAMRWVKRGDWRSPWMFTGESVWRDKSGTARGNSVSWLAVRCNSCDCPGRALIAEEDVLTAALPESREEKSDG